jgi:hypothetical protein
MILPPVAAKLKFVGLVHASPASAHGVVLFEALQPALVTPNLNPKVYNIFLGGLFVSDELAEIYFRSYLGEDCTN